MKLVGLTGGIVSHLLLAEHGIPVVDADAIAHAVLSPGSAATRRVVAAFGDEILSTDSPPTIDRKKLGAVVFNDRYKRRELEQIQMPHIALALVSHLFYHWLRGTPVVCLDAPLLFESGLHRLCSLVVVVYVEGALRLERLRARDGRAGAEDARARIAAQPISSEEKARRAGVVVDNSGSREALAERVREVVPALLSRNVWQRLSSGPGLAAAAVAAALARRRWLAFVRGETSRL